MNRLLVDLMVLGLTLPAMAGTAPAAASSAAAATPPALRLVQAEVSLDQAVEIVRQRYDGKVVNASTRRNGERIIHYIRVLTEDGKVHNVRVDARTGRVF